MYLVILYVLIKHDTLCWQPFSSSSQQHRHHTARFTNAVQSIATSVTNLVLVDHLSLSAHTPDGSTLLDVVTIDYLL